MKKDGTKVSLTAQNRCFMYKNLKLYFEQGQIRDDKDFIRIKEEIVRIILDKMKDEGYVPVFDLGPYWHTSRGDKKYYFDLIMYGIYVGKKKCQEIDFWQSGRLVKNGKPV